MGILDRIATVVKSNINELIDRAEDPEKMLKQLLLDMEEDLLEVKKQVAAAIATEKQLHRQLTENQAKADEWQAKAELAVNKGEDDLAKEALSRKKSYAEAAASFQVQWESQKKNVELLRANLGQLEAKINEARIKKDMLIARARQAQANETVHKAMGKMDTTSALSAFDRMESKVHEKEASAAAFAELTQDSLEDKFKALESKDDLDAELAALKAKLNQG